MKFCLTIVTFCALMISQAMAQHVYTIDTSSTFQTIRGFGASDSWSNDLIQTWNDSTKNHVADLLFSNEINRDGTCKGAGLSVWRYNLGTGSAEQGDSSNIGDPYKRTGMIIRPDGSVNPLAQAGTQSMLKAAKDRGVENLVMFCNSPPVYLTLNGKAYTEKESESNLAPENYEPFAEYISKSLAYFERENIHFNFISPVNEPEWDWSRRTRQEGNSYNNQQIAGLARIINQNFTSDSISTEIQITESGLLLFVNPGYRFKPHNDNQAKSFFKTGKANYIGDQPLLAKQICAHGYFTEWPLWINRKVRKRLARTTSRYHIEYWMTEYCILKQNKEISGHGRDLGMNTALYVARVMHNDLVYGNTSAWCWWLGISTADFKDGLVYANRDGSGITDSKTLWTMGNFSRFIKPGAKRIGVEGKQENELMVSAYRNTGKESIVIVIINMKPEKQLVRLKNLPDGTLTAWETSDKMSLKKSEQITSTEQFTVQAKSITSLVLNN
jgi:O-glycosyl hydrolase